MADVPISSKDLDNLAKSLQELNSTLKSVDYQAREVFGRDIPAQVRIAERDFKQALADSEKAMQATLNSMTTKWVAAMGRMKKEEAAALVDAAKNSAESYVKNLLGTIQSGLSFGLPRALGPLAMVAGPINQLSVIQAENMKIVAQWGAAYGNILPGQLQNTLKSMGNINLQVVQMSNRYRQSREDIIATTEALARNTVVQQKGIMATTQSIAALSRLHGIPMADLTNQMIALTKELNVQVEKTPELYGNVAAYAKEAGMGQQFLMQTSIALATSLKNQGANIQDYAGFIDKATKSLESMGLSERAAVDAAQASIRGLSGTSFGVGAYIATIMETNVSKLMAQKGGIDKISPELKSAYVNVATAMTGKKYDMAHAQEAIEYVNKQGGLLGAGYLAQISSGTQMFREAARMTPQALGLPRSLAPLFAEGTLHQANVQQFNALMTPGAGQFAAGAAGMSTQEQEATKNYKKLAEEISQAQRSDWDKIVGVLSEIKTDTRWMGPLTAIAGNIAIAITLSKWAEFKAGAMKNAPLYGRLLRKGGGIAEGVEAEASEVAPYVTKEGYTIYPAGAAAGTAAEEAAPAALGTGAKIASMGMKALPTIGGVVAGGVSGYYATKSMTANTSWGGGALRGLGAEAAGAFQGAQMALMTGQLELVPLAAASGAAAAALSPIVEALTLTKNLFVDEKGKLAQVRQLMQDTEDKAATKLSGKLGFDKSSIPLQDQGKVAALYNAIQAGNRAGEAINLGRIIDSFVKSGAMTKEEAAKALKELAQVAPQMQVGPNMALINALSGKQVTITISDPGTANASLNSVSPDTPHGSQDAIKYL
jgi:polyhydroxyalkanoate synthesis regulator phasin